LSSSASHTSPRAAAPVGVVGESGGVGQEGELDLDLGRRQGAVGGDVALEAHRPDEAIEGDVDHLRDGAGLDQGAGLVSLRPVESDGRILFRHTNDTTKRW
jgi:hypothetical protein